MREGRSRAAFLLALLIPLAALAGAQVGSRRVGAWLARPPASTAAHPVTFELGRGSSAGATARELGRRGLVEPAWGLRLYLQLSGQAGKLQAGEYLIDRPLSPVELAELLVSGRVVLHPFTIPEGLDLFETAHLLAQAGWWAEQELLAVFADPTPIRAVDPDAPDLEGYLFPETYHFAKGTSAREAASVLVARFIETWRRHEGDARAAAMGLTVRQVGSIAALVEEETPLPAERRVVASVYHNRHRRGMRMEADPTVIHAMKRDGAWPGGQLLLEHLTYPSPYNTYQVAGLPPGPICSYGEAAMVAALDPVPSNLLFFVATGTGGHRFGETLAEHQRNVALYRAVQREARASAAASVP